MEMNKKEDEKNLEKNEEIHNKIQTKNLEMKLGLTDEEEDESNDKE